PAPAYRTTQEGAMTDTTDTAVRDYLREHLRCRRVDEDVRRVRIRGAEATGYRLIDGGQTGRTADAQSTWEITDWRTGELLASGIGDDTYDTEVARLDPTGKWLHIDAIDTDLTEADPVGIPASLANAL